MLHLLFIVDTNHGIELCRTGGAFFIMIYTLSVWTYYLPTRSINIEFKII